MVFGQKKHFLKPLECRKQSAILVPIISALIVIVIVSKRRFGNLNVAIIKLMVIKSHPKDVGHRLTCLVRLIISSLNSFADKD